MALVQHHRLGQGSQRLYEAIIAVGVWSRLTLLRSASTSNEKSGQRFEQSRAQLRSVFLPPLPSLPLSFLLLLPLLFAFVVFALTLNATAAAITGATRTASPNRIPLGSHPQHPQAASP